MKRKALLIGYPGPGAPGAETFLKGVRVDLAKYRRFLESSLGGAWESDEIITLDSPSRAQVSSAVSSLRAVDYSFVAFCGHGFYSQNTTSTHVEISDGVDFDSDVLRVGARKRLLILDCCRKSLPRILLEVASDSVAKGLKALNRDECRYYYDKRIEESADGLVVLNACSIEEEAGDDSARGGYYSSSLMDGATEWLRASTTDTDEYYSTYSVVLAHEFASVAVEKRSGGSQNPTIERPRSGKSFPFGIVA